MSSSTWSSCTQCGTTPPLAARFCPNCGFPITPKDGSEERKDPLILFYSYAYTDELLRNELEKHLSSLQRQGTITGWHDHKISPGSNRATGIDTYLNSASIILLLISPDFLASDYCYSVEMQQALKRHNNGNAYVIPIILRPVYWEVEPIGHLQALPYKAKPITTWSNQDEAFLDVVRGIRAVVNRIQTPSSLVSLPTGEKPNTETPPDTDHWEEGGALSEHVGSLARNKQWPQAEAAARQIADSQKRSLVLHKLVSAMAQSEQWERAEAVAHSIDDQSYKQQALTKLANRLIETQNWERAINIAYAVNHPSERSRLFKQLSQGMAGNEKWGSQALYFAYEADRTHPATPYSRSLSQHYLDTSKLPSEVDERLRSSSYQGESLGTQPLPSEASWTSLPGISPTRHPIPSPLPSLMPPSPRKHRRVVGYRFLLAIVAILILSLLLFVLLFTNTFTGTLYFLLWGVVGIISIYIIIRIISFIWDTWFR